jgi:hypothetical protein
MSDCSNCGDYNNEFFRMFATEFNVAEANKLVVEGRETRVVPEAFLRSVGLPLDPVKCLNCSAPVDDCTCGKTSHHISMVHINEKHLAHLQDPNRPGIIAMLLWKKPQGDSNAAKCSAILIDGNHRAVRAFREGREFRAIMLTPQETWKIMSGHTSACLNPNTKAGKARLAELGWS